MNRADILAMIDKAIEHALRPLKRRVLNMLVKGVLNVVYDRHLFEAQVTGLDDGEGNVDLFDGVEIFQDYGHGFHPLAGAEHLTAFLMGSRANGITIRIADRRYKLAGTREGEVWLNDDLGQKVHLTRDGIDVVTPKRHRVFCEDYELHASRSYLINVGGYADKLKGNVKVVGNAGAVVPAGALLQFGGREYTVDAEVTLVGTNAQVAVTARIAGSAGNCAAGSKLAFVSPVAGVQSQATAETGLTDGAEPEEDRLLLSRLLRRMQAPPHGGAKADYVSWALEVPGVTRAWAGQLLDAEGNTVPGSVWLTFVCDGQAGSIIPDADKVAEVQAYIDARRPVTADVTVAAPTPKPINFTITGLNPASQAVKDAVTAELADVLEREAVPGATILLSHLREAISLAAGENDHQLTAPAANVAHARHEIAVMGTITWA